MNKITADWIYPITSAPIKNHVIIYDDLGNILQIEPKENHDSSSIQRVDGAIIPGFINAHCHLELSHMKGIADTGTGLIPFISSVVKHRDTKEAYILEQIEKYDAAMWDNGIQAVGDISNAPHTSVAKSKSNIRYHTFIEMFDFLNPGFTQSSYDQYLASYQAMRPKKEDKISLSPHAPYTVSPDLFKKINDFNRDLDITVSIHNQETPAENELFLSKTGALIDFYKSFDMALDHFDSIQKRSIQYALPLMDPSKNTLLVHNTTCIKEDIEFAKNWSDRITWVSCPNANLYIENRLPNYTLFTDAELPVAIGTDSLTSNWQLSILEEIKTIKKYQSFIDNEALLAWSTINGARALGFEDTLGSIEVGKRPGLLQITADSLKGIIIDSHSTVSRIN